MAENSDEESYTGYPSVGELAGVEELEPLEHQFRRRTTPYR